MPNTKAFSSGDDAAAARICWRYGLNDGADLAGALPVTLGSSLDIICVRIWTIHEVRTMQRVMGDAR